MLMPCAILFFFCHAIAYAYHAHHTMMTTPRRCRQLHSAALPYFRHAIFRHAAMPAIRMRAALFMRMLMPIFFVDLHRHAMLRAAITLIAMLLISLSFRGKMMPPSSFFACTIPFYLPATFRC